MAVYKSKKPTKNVGNTFLESNIKTSLEHITTTLQKNLKVKAKQNTKK